VLPLWKQRSSFRTRKHKQAYITHFPLRCRDRGAFTTKENVAANLTGVEQNIQQNAKRSEQLVSERNNCWKWLSESSDRLRE
jgi:hypothetical protein